MSERRTIFCATCNKDIEARLTDGKEIYPQSPSFYHLPFWKCDICGNYVGCHHKTKNRTKPLGCIPSEAVRNARKHIHKLLDSIWKENKMARKEIYAAISEKLGWKYHTANIRTIDEAREVYRILQEIVVKGVNHVRENT